MEVMGDGSISNQYSMSNVQLPLPWHSPQACLALQLERAGQVCWGMNI